MMRGYNWFGNSFCPWGFGGGFSFWHGVILLGLAIAVVGIVLMSRKKYRSDESLELLKRMFVSGDLSEEEYLRKKSIIEKR